MRQKKTLQLSHLFKQVYVQFLFMFAVLLNVLYVLLVFGDLQTIFRAWHLSCLPVKLQWVPIPVYSGIQYKPTECQ